MEIKLPKLGATVKLKDLAIFSRQFATMINSGLSLLRSLTILEEQTANKDLAKTLTEVRQDVETGPALSDALAKHPKIFPPLMINMTRAGEVGGFLDSVMLQIAENYEAEVKLRGKVKSAMTYPVVVFCIAILAVIGMLLFIVPVFAKMFITLGGTLPLPTRVLIELSAPAEDPRAADRRRIDRRDDHRGSGSSTRKVSRAFVDPIKLKVPVFGNLFQKIALAGSPATSARCCQSGVPILQSLDIVAETTGNMVLGNAVRDVQDSVRRGESLTAPADPAPGRSRRWSCR